MRTPGFRRLAMVVWIAAGLFLLAAVPAFADSAHIDSPTATLSKGPGTQTITIDSVTYNCTASGTGTPDLHIAIDQAANAGDAIAVGDAPATCDGADHTQPITATQTSKRKFHGGSVLANLTVYPCGFGCGAGSAIDEITLDLVRA